MTKRGMPNVMHQRQRLGQIDVQVERRRDGARNLGDLHGVSEAGAKVVGIAAGKDLRFIFQPAKGTGVDDAVTVTLEGVAVRVRRLRIAPSAGILHTNRVAGEHGLSLSVGAFPPHRPPGDDKVGSPAPRFRNLWLAATVWSPPSSAGPTSPWQTPGPSATWRPHPCRLPREWSCSIHRERVASEQWPA